MTPAPLTPPVRTGSTVHGYTVVRYTDGHPAGTASADRLADAVAETRRPFAKVLDRLEHTDGLLARTQSTSAAILLDGFLPVVWIELAYTPPPANTPGRAKPALDDIYQHGGAYTVDYTDSDASTQPVKTDRLIPSAFLAADLAVDFLYERLADLHTPTRAGHPWHFTATVGLHHLTVARLLLAYVPPPAGSVPDTDPALRDALTAAAFQADPRPATPTS
ncbi:hypothetical protein I6A60_38620 [Frankia sp. AgB1.9]|uniref:hypothetical protein n=1 Tax=unclassified Frankia TaxID=2632575 RepID=UPI0019342CD5|nr:MULTISPECIES: hypothetical protein [unclassified Frankia]MBL7491175.1 hypothetical protein [Frankia sp. AgW1.1]MBL7553704.1 hypothetical protein [Frankia sp. AgB1.9]MBL7618406.1 hypothetical protein [Frankia sp. AgB1.8]